MELKSYKRIKINKIKRNGILNFIEFKNLHQNKSKLNQKKSLYNN